MITLPNSKSSATNLSQKWMIILSRRCSSARISSYTCLNSPVQMNSLQVKEMSVAIILTLSRVLSNRRSLTWQKLTSSKKEQTSSNRLMNITSFLPLEVLMLILRIKCSLQLVRSMIAARVSILSTRVYSTKTVLNKKKRNTTTSMLFIMVTTKNTTDSFYTYFSLLYIYFKSCKFFKFLENNIQRNEVQIKNMASSSF